MDQCFLCNEAGPVRQVEIEVARTSGSALHHGHSHGGTTHHYELKALCEACITRQVEVASTTLKYGALAAGAVGLMGLVGGLLAFLAPFLLLAVAGAFAYFFSR